MNSSNILIENLNPTQWINSYNETDVDTVVENFNLIPENLNLNESEIEFVEITQEIEALDNNPVTITHLEIERNTVKLNNYLKPIVRQQKPKKFKCDYEGCPLAFSDRSNLLTHYRIHTGERPFICNYDGCIKSYRQKSTYERHRITHIGIRQFPCIECKISFKRLDSLKKHKTTTSHNNVIKSLENGAVSLSSLCFMMRL